MSGEETLNCKVYSIEPRDWRVEGLAVSKEIHLSTDLGLRVHLMYVGYKAKEDGLYEPILMLRFNFSWGMSGKGDYLLLRLRKGTEVLSLAVIRRMATGSITDFICLDSEQITGVTLALAANEDLHAEIHGPDGLVFEFPVPADPQFYPLFRSVLRKMFEENDAQNH